MQSVDEGFDGKESNEKLVNYDVFFAAVVDFTW